MKGGIKYDDERVAGYVPIINLFFCLLADTL